MFSKRSVFSTLGLVALVGLSAFIAVRSTVFKSSVDNRTITSGIGHDVTNWSMAKSGKLQSIVVAKKMIHYSNDDTDLFTVKGTYFNLTKVGVPPWHISAKNGHLIGDIGQLTLTHNVVIQRFAIGGFKPLRLDTQKLIYSNKKNVAQTDDFVKFTEPATGNITTATGMWVNFNTNQVKLLKDIHTTFIPIKKKKDVKHEKH